MFTKYPGNRRLFLFIKSTIRAARWGAAVLVGFILVGFVSINLAAILSGPMARLPNPLIIANAQTNLLHLTPRRRALPGAGDCNPDFQGIELGIETQVDKEIAREGETLVFTITVINKGMQETRAAEVAVELTGKATIIEAHTSQGSEFDYQNAKIIDAGSWLPDELGACQAAVLTITATVDSDAGGTTITNTAHVTMPDQQVPVESAVAVTVPDEADLTITKTVNQATPDFGALVVYTISITNNESDEVKDIQIQDKLPDGLDFDHYTASQGVYTETTGLWQVGTLAGGGSAALTIAARVNICPADDASVTNTASIQTPQVAPSKREAEAVITVGACADLVLTETVNRASPLNAGDLVIYTITVTNNGPSQATGVSITDILPSILTRLSHTLDRPYRFANNAWRLEKPLRKGESVILTIKARASCFIEDDGAISNTAKVHAAQPDPDLSNNEDTERLRVFRADGCYVYLPMTVKIYEPPCRLYYFTLNDGDWKNHEDGYTKSGYIDDEFQIRAKDPQRTHLAGADDSYENYEISTQARWLDASSIGDKYGLVFGMDTNLNSFYTFMIYPDKKKYEIKYYNGSWNLILEGTSSAINSGLTPNHLRVKRLNGTISISVNGSLLEGNVTATQISGKRKVGVGVGPYTQPNPNYIAEARFDNYEICSLDNNAPNSIISAAAKTGPLTGSVPGGD